MVPEGLDLTGAPGSRAPHLWVRRGQDRLSTLDLYEDSLVLLSDAAQPTGWHEAAAGVAAGMRVPLKSYRVGGSPGADLNPDDEETDWARAHGVTRGGAVLVRPGRLRGLALPGPRPRPGVDAAPGGGDGAGPKLSGARDTPNVDHSPFTC